jgi:Pyruvate kinase, barrel domain
MQRATKIVATLGPASSTPDVLKRMLAAGVDVVRMNFSHGVAKDHEERARMVREAARSLGREVAIMADLQGPKIRVGKFENGKVALKTGATFILDAECALGNEERAGLDYKELPHDVSPGVILLLDDGLIRLRVESVRGSAITTRVEAGGTLSNNKGINRQGGGLTAPALTAKDMEDMKTAVAIEADYLAVSFPKNKEDMYMARQLLRAAGGKALLIAKVERAEAITALEEIIDASDGIMVARGDLAVEVGNASVPGLQKRMIKLALQHNKLTITATQMMESMIHNPVPTRAEVSDVANAVLDGTDAVMLSAETAAGRFPVETIETMSQRRGGEVGNRQARPGLPRPHLHAHRSVDCQCDAVHGVSPGCQGHRLAHAIGFDSAVDVAAQLRLPDLRADARPVGTAQDVAVSQCPSALSGTEHRPRRGPSGGRGPAADERPRRQRRPDRAHHRRTDGQVRRYQRAQDRQGRRASLALPGNTRGVLRRCNRLVTIAS